MTKVVKQNRFKSVVLWSGLISAVLSFLVGVGMLDLGLSKDIEQMIAFIFTLLAAFGVMNSPTTKNGF
jgi:uncharacterized membrane protein